MQKLIFIFMAILAIGQVAFPEIQKQIEDYKRKFPKLDPEPEYDDVEQGDVNKLIPVAD